MIELIALLAIWGIAAACWWGQHISPAGYVDRAHRAEQRVSELEGEVKSLTEMCDLYQRRVERSIYYG